MGTPFRNTSDSNLSSLRSLTELTSGFVIAVMLLRGLILEGYLISTGSMAPGLLGYHKQVTCPECEHVFAFGISFDESVGASTLAAADSDLPDRFASCPNCGQVNIDVSQVPTNHGDQLLVHKNVFDLRSPRRWETVVFRNPQNPGEAYVKRVVGLPGETIRVFDGDLFVGGKIARKDYATQRDMRIPVFDIRTIPDNTDWELPWQLDGEWEVVDGLLTSRSGDRTPSADAEWIQLRNWRWYGGNHTVEVPLPPEDAIPDWNAFLKRFDRVPVSWATRIAYDRETQVLRCHGVMPMEMQQDLIRSAANPNFQHAIHRLAALSHLAPMTDKYGYNAMVPSPEFPIRDVMLQATLRLDELPEAVIVRIPMRQQVFELRIDPANQTAKLFSDGNSDELRHGQFVLTPAEGNDETQQLQIEVSNFDRRVLIAINNEVVFAPLDLAAHGDFSGDQPPAVPFVESGSDSARRTALLVHQQNQLALGVVGGSVQLWNLQLFRDVYYTPGRRKNGIDEDFVVPVGEYFVQGDNSPVSSDSRSWEQPSVPHRLLLGKPFVVHLPSRPGKLTIGGRELSIRIPDFRRIRYIH